MDEHASGDTLLTSFDTTVVPFAADRSPPDRLTAWPLEVMTIDQKIAIELDNIEQKLRSHLQARSDEIVREIARRWPQMGIPEHPIHEPVAMDHPLTASRRHSRVAVTDSDEMEHAAKDGSGNDIDDLCSSAGAASPAELSPPVQGRFVHLITPLRSCLREPHRLLEFAASARAWASERHSSTTLDTTTISAQSD